MSPYSLIPNRFEDPIQPIGQCVTNKSMQFFLRNKSIEVIVFPAAVTATGVVIDCNCLPIVITLTSCSFSSYFLSGFNAIEMEISSMLHIEDQ